MQGGRVPGAAQTQGSHLDGPGPGGDPVHPRDEVGQQAHAPAVEHLHAPQPGSGRHAHDALGVVPRGDDASHVGAVPEIVLEIGILDAVQDADASDHVQVGMGRVQARVDDGDVDVDQGRLAVDGRGGAEVHLDAVGARGDDLGQGAQLPLRLDARHLREAPQLFGHPVGDPAGEALQGRLEDVVDGDPVDAAQRRCLGGRIHRVPLEDHDVAPGHQGIPRLAQGGEVRLPVPSPCGLGPGRSFLGTTGDKQNGRE